MLREGEESLFVHPLPPTRAERLKHVKGGCEKVLIDLQTLVKRYESLGTQSKRTWDRMRWGNEDVAEIRARLTSNISLLTAFISTSQVSVETKLDKFIEEFRQGKRESTIVSLQSVDSLSADDRAVWRTIRKELEEIGISVAAFDANRNFIFDWFIRAVEAGAFEEQNAHAIDDGGNYSDKQKWKSYDEHDSGSTGRQTEHIDTQSLESVTEDQLFARLPSSQSAHALDPNSSKRSPKTFNQILASTPTKPEAKRRVPRVAALLAGVSRPRQGLIKAVEAMDVPKAIKILKDEASFHILDMGTLDRALWSATYQAGSSRLLVAELIARGGNVNYISSDTSERTPLWNSVANGSFDTVQLLLQNGADVNYTGSKRPHMYEPKIGASDFAPRAALKQDASILRLLISAGLNVNAQYKLCGLFPQHELLKESWSNDFSLIHEAAYLGAVPALEVLLEHGAEIDAACSEHGTALMLALLNGREGAAQLLLEKGANPDFDAAVSQILLWPKLRNPIRAAVFGRKPSLVRLLLNRGVLVDDSTLNLAAVVAVASATQAPKYRVQIERRRDQEIMMMLRDRVKRGNQI